MISWLRFEWKTDVLPESFGSLAPLVIRRAAKDDLGGVVKAVPSAFTMDSSWSDVHRRLGDYVVELVEQTFEQEQPNCLVLTHGTRVIGASVLSVDPEAESHLLTGPCVLHEYRNRGLGQALLRASLEFLGGHEVSVARGLTRANCVAARYVYPKFQGRSTVFEGDPLGLKAE